MQVTHDRSLSQGGRDRTEQWQRDSLRLGEVCCFFKVGENLLVLSVDGATTGEDSERAGVGVCDCSEGDGLDGVRHIRL